jgi:hypothetical protein
MEDKNPKPDLESARAFQDEWLRLHAHSHGEQDENGIDLSLIRANLRLTPTERIIAAQQEADWLEKIMSGNRGH